MKTNEDDDHEDDILNYIKEQQKDEIDLQIDQED